MARGLELFKAGVGSLLKQHCVECHGGGKTKGGFDLATREGLLKGGDEGLAVVAGNANESKLLKLITHTAEPHMPSKKPKLPDDAIAKITEWIAAGAPYAEPLVTGAEIARDRSTVTEKDKEFWSFQSLKIVQPPTVKDARWIRNPIDQFILARQEQAGLKPNGLAEKRVLIRRAFYDLTGLPPAPEEIDEFLKDTAPDAYARLVERLLASPHYGERWGRHWLDLARFGESHGYEQDYERAFAYQYRDFVIRALNRDLPFDTFAKWQIAGDELAPDEPDAWLATGFLAAGTHATQITANQAEKERYDELDDKIATLGTAMLGLTLGCARCHDHKFDPIPTSDYYRLISTFTTAVRSDHCVELNPKAARTAKAAWSREHAALTEALKKFEQEEWPGRFEQCLKEQPPLPAPDWLVLEAENFSVSAAITKNTKRDDGSYLVDVSAGAADTYTFKARVSLTNLTAVRLEALADEQLPHSGPGLGPRADFALAEFQLSAAPLNVKDAKATNIALKAHQVFVSRSDGSLEQINSDLADALDGKRETAWRVQGPTGRDHVALLTFDQPVTFDSGAALTFTLRFASDEWSRRSIGRLRLAITAQSFLPGPQAGGFSSKLLADAQAALLLSPDKRTNSHVEALSQIYRRGDPDWRKLNNAVNASMRRQPCAEVVKALVTSEGLPAVRLHTQGPDFYEKTFHLKRGDLAQKQDPAEPGVLQVLRRASDSATRPRAEKPKEARTPFHRAALANWLTDVDSGAGHLLARVMVNRLWHHHFGRGLVSTPSDFGATGEKPTHPELLDWLAGQFIRGGWRLKPMHRLIMTSAAYTQSAETDEARARLDPENRLWWRRTPRRLEAEIVRDAILDVSGRLDSTMFGPGSLDEGHTRRSIYFTIKRSKLIPMMVQFDAPDSLQGVGRRVNTTIAPQALLLLNNPHVRACAVEFARRLESAAKHSTHDAVTLAYELALGRPPAALELSEATEFLDQQAKLSGTPEGTQAALADFCQALFGLNEFVFVE